MDFAKLEDFLATEPRYRIMQVKTALFGQLVENWQDFKFLPLALRNKLNKKFPLLIKAEIFFSKAKDVAKARLVLDDGLKIETVLMRHKDNRNTVCVSSQVGCLLNCRFCATGKMGFKRNLTTSEIINQVLFFARSLAKEKAKITNLVFMGMGEPFLNYENVISAIRILNDKDGFNLGARHISISTAGVIEGIKKLFNEKLQVNLAISLHAPNDQLRSELIPLNKKYPLEALFKAVDDYLKKTNRRVMFEYLLLKDVNDSDQCAERLAKLMKKPLYLLNLIRYNPTGDFQPSTPERIKEFKNILDKHGVKYTQRYSFGQDIKAACGQLITEKS